MSPYEYRTIVAVHKGSDGRVDKFNYYNPSHMLNFRNIRKMPGMSSEQITSASSTCPAQEQFPFFDLPAELQIMVLDKALTQEDDETAFATIVVVDRTDWTPSAREEGWRFANTLSRLDSIREGDWIPARDSFEGICIYFPATVVQLFTSRNFFETALKIFATKTPLDIQGARLERVIPRLSGHPILQRIIRATAARTRSLMISTSSSPKMIGISQNPSFPASQYFQRLEEVNLFGNQPLFWHAFKHNGNKMLVLDEHAGPMKFIAHEDRYKGYTIEHAITLRDALEYDREGACFQRLMPEMQSVLSATEAFNNARSLRTVFSAQGLHPKIHFWQIVYYMLGKYYTPTRRAKRAASMVAVIDVDNFDVVRFAADVEQWSKLGRTFLVDTLVRPGRVPKVQSQLLLTYGVNPVDGELSES